MEIYKLLPDTNGFIVFEKDGHTVLVNTGSSRSFFAKNIPLSICDVDIPVQNGIMEMSACGIDLALVSKHVGVNVTILLGMEDLARFKVIIDESAKRIQFDTDDIPLSPDWYAIPAEKIGGCMFLIAKVNGVPRKMLLDSGVTTSFAEKAWLLDGCVAKGNRIDFHLLSGYESAPIFRALSEMAGFTFPVRFSVLTNELREKIAKENFITSEKIHGIFGSSLLENHRGYLDVSAGVFKVMK